MAKDHDITVAVPFEEGSPANLVVLGARPRVFVDFPLFGTRGLPFPMVINCPRLEPNENRDGIYTKGETADVKSNREIIERSLSLLKLVARFVAESEMEGRHILAAVHS